MSTARSARVRKVLFVNRFAWPDHSATSQILTQVSEAVAASGNDVHIVTSRARYSGGGGDLARQETVNGVTIHRTWTARFGRNNLAGRALDYMSFYASSFLSVLKHARPGDLVIAKTDPPLLGVTIGFAAVLKGARRANWLQDLYPEVAAELGVSLARGPMGGLLRALRNRSLKRSDLVVAIGSRMKERLVSEGLDAARIVILPNFSRDDEIAPDPPGTGTLRQAWGFRESDFVVGYSGNLGRAHDYETVLDAASALRNTVDMKFLFVGGGHAHSLVEQAARKRGLETLSFQPYQPESQLSQSLSVPDVHWLSLKPALEGLIVPSKVYGIAAVARPVVMIGDPDGEVGRIVTQYACGAVFAPGDWEALSDFLKRLQQEPDYRRTLGRNARAWLSEHASRTAVLGQWPEVLAGIPAAPVPESLA